MTDTVTGCRRGKITWKKARRGRAPSIAAQSSSSLGTVFTNPWYMKRESGTPRPQYTTPSPQREFVRWSVLATFTSAIMKEWKGIIMGATHRRNTSQLSRVRVRESLNPAREARSTTPAVPRHVTRRVLKNRLGYRMRVKAFAKFSKRRWDGSAITFSMIWAKVFSELMATRISG